MADAVYMALDRMVPALEDLQIRGLFHAEEIRAIVAKRRDFEFLLRRRTARKADFLRYIEYEMNLDELRRIRKDKAGLTKSTLSDFAGQQLIHFIFERALKKFHGDLELWLQYLDYCDRTGSNKAHSRALAQALQIFPRTPGLWIRAASHEYFDNASPPAARVLMQRGLRLNGRDSMLLWTQYFKMELLYVEKLRGRREVLGINEQRREEREEEEGEGDSTNSVDLPRLDVEEEEEEEAERDEEVQRSVQEVLTGAVPRVVYKSAIAARPKDLSLRQECLNILAGFMSGQGSREEEEHHFQPLVEEIVQGIGKDFSPEDAIWSRALYVLKVGGLRKSEAVVSRTKKKMRKTIPSHEEEMSKWRQGLSNGEQACLATLKEEGVEKYPDSAKMWSHYLTALLQIFPTAPVNVFVEAFRHGENSLVALPCKYYLEWLRLLEGDDREAVLSRALKHYPHAAKLWVERLRLEVDRKNEKDVHRIMELSLKMVHTSNKSPSEKTEDEEEEEASHDDEEKNLTALWLLYVRYIAIDRDLQGSSEQNNQGRFEVTKILERALASVTGRGKVEICQVWYEYEGMVGLARALNLMSSESWKGEKQVSGKLLDLCLRAVAEGGDDDADHHPRDLFEAALKVLGDRQESKALWEAYEALERSQGQHRRAGTIRWRMEKSLLV